MPIPERGRQSGVVHRTATATATATASFDTRASRAAQDQPVAVGQNRMM